MNWNHKPMKTIFLFSFFSLLYFFCFAQSWGLTQKILSPEVYNNTEFAQSVSISGNVAIMGSAGNGFDSTGPLGLPSAGAAFIYERDSNDLWILKQKLPDQDREIGDQFGSAVSIFGKYAIVSAPGEEDTVGNPPIIISGVVFIYEQDSLGHWNQVAKLDAGPDRNHIAFFGKTVSITDGYAIVGHDKEHLDENGNNPRSGAGAAYIYKRQSSGTWVFDQKIVPTDRDYNDEFGYSVSISGNNVIVGAIAKSGIDTAGLSFSDVGAAYFFEVDSSGHWNQVQKVQAFDLAFGDVMGWSVAINNKVAVAGAPFKYYSDSTTFLWNIGACYVFEQDSGGIWQNAGKLVAPDFEAYDYFGKAVSISERYVLVGVVEKRENGFWKNGAAYLFGKQTDGSWGFEKKILHPLDSSIFDPEFGISVAISDTVALIGSSGEGLYQFTDSAIVDIGTALFYEKCLTLSQQTIQSCIPFVSPSGHHIWSESGLYMDTIVQDLQCDEIITIDLTISEVPVDSIHASSCFEFISPSGKYSWNQTGIYVDTIPGINACDSIIYIDLNIDSISAAIGQEAMTLFALDSTAVAYQWLDCSNGYAVIPGAINQSFSPTQNGTYAVEIWGSACQDTSQCIQLLGVPIESIPLAEALIVSPNPTGSHVSIECPQTYEEIVISLMTPIGQTLNSTRRKNTAKVDMKIEEASGVYLIKIETSTGDLAHFRIVKL